MSTTVRDMMQILKISDLIVLSLTKSCKHYLMLDLSETSLSFRAKRPVSCETHGACLQGKETHPQNHPSQQKELVQTVFGAVHANCPLFLKRQTGGIKKEFGQTVCSNCSQLGLLGWVFFWGGFSLMSGTPLHVLRNVEKFFHGHMSLPCHTSKTCPQAPFLL